MSRAWKAGTGIRIVVTPWTFGSAQRGAPKTAGCALRRDVVIEVKDVVGVVAPFHVAEALDVRSVGRADSVCRLVVAEVVEPAVAAEMRLQNRERLARPFD